MNQCCESFYPHDQLTRTSDVKNGLSILLAITAMIWLALPCRPPGEESHILSPVLDGWASIEWKENAKKSPQHTCLQRKDLGFRYKPIWAFRQFWWCKYRRLSRLSILTKGKTMTGENPERTQQSTKDLLSRHTHLIHGLLYIEKQAHYHKVINTRNP